MITREEWLCIPLEARLIEQANHVEDELLRDDLIAAVKRLDTLSERILALNAEITRLERVATTVTPY
jgi:hypothetical protein